MIFSEFMLKLNKGSDLILTNFKQWLLDSKNDLACLLSIPIVLISFNLVLDSIDQLTILLGIVLFFITFITFRLIETAMRFILGDKNKDFSNLPFLLLIVIFITAIINNVVF